jgi:hypothetical protein
LREDQGEYRASEISPSTAVMEMVTPISLALGSLVTCPQTITFDAKGNRNDVEHYTSDAKGFSTFIPSHGWDSPVKETVEAWFSVTEPLLPFEELAVWIRQHLDACSIEMYLETRALSAATLLDVLAGRYSTIWAPQSRPQDIAFRTKLKRLLADLDITIRNKHLDAIIKARNSLVHSGKFVASENDQTYSQYQNLLLLGRSMLLRLAGFQSTLHEAIQA